MFFILNFYKILIYFYSQTFKINIYNILIQLHSFFCVIKINIIKLKKLIKIISIALQKTKVIYMIKKINHGIFENDFY